MKRIYPVKPVCRTLLPLLLAAVFLLPAASLPVMAAASPPHPSLQVGDRAPLFSVVTNQDTLADYDRDYYGSHHLVLTFFPAAFTPV